MISVKIISQTLINIFPPVQGKIPFSCICSYIHCVLQQRVLLSGRVSFPPRGKGLSPRACREFGCGGNPSPLPLPPPLPPPSPLIPCHFPPSHLCSPRTWAQVEKRRRENPTRWELGPPGQLHPSQSFGLVWS